MRSCSICGKGYKRGFSRSHSNRATIRKLQPNLQWTRTADRRVRACTQCIKTLTKSKPQHLDRRAPYPTARETIGNPAIHPVRNQTFLTGQESAEHSQQGVG